MCCLIDAAQAALGNVEAVSYGDFIDLCRNAIQHNNSVVPLIAIALINRGVAKHQRGNCDGEPEPGHLHILEDADRGNRLSTSDPVRCLEKGHRAKGHLTLLMRSKVVTLARVVNKNFRFGDKTTNLCSC